MKNSKKAGTARRKLAAPAASTNIQFKTILTTADFSDASRAGVRYALALAEKLGATVALLHVIEPFSRLAGLGAVGRTDSEVALSARVELEPLAKRERGGGSRLTPIVRAGKPFNEISTAAHDSAADLIVIATHGCAVWERVVCGSTADGVVRHASCPLLTVPVRALPQRARKTSAFSVKRVLVPMDFSKLSKDALPWVTCLARPVQGRSRPAPRC